MAQALGCEKIVVVPSPTPEGATWDDLCSVELFRPEYWERDPVELAATARSATLEIVEEYFSAE